MLDKLKYINHLNQEINLGSDGIFLSDLDIYDYEWLHNSNFDEITNFRKGIVKKKMKIIISANSETEGIKKRNEIFEIFEQDILSNVHGRLYKDNFYLSCYVLASKKSNWFLSKNYMEMVVTIVTDKSDWISEQTFEFSKNKNEYSNVSNDLKKYSYNYGYFYRNQISSSSIMNNAVSTSDFLIRIYGSVRNPLILIGENSYQVNISINEGEYIEINSEEKTIKLVYQNGRIENIYWSASKDSYIFEPILKGLNTISWDGSFSFDLIIKNKRSEPLWT